MKHQKKRIIQQTEIVNIDETPIWREDTFLFAVLLFPSILGVCSLLYAIQVFLLER